MTEIFGRQIQPLIVTRHRISDVDTGRDWLTFKRKIMTLTSGQTLYFQEKYASMALATRLKRRHHYTNLEPFTGLFFGHSRSNQRPLNSSINCSITVPRASLTHCRNVLNDTTRERGCSKERSLIYLRTLVRITSERKACSSNNVPPARRNGHFGLFS